jgi:hypothetical protein
MTTTTTRPAKRRIGEFAREKGVSCELVRRRDPVLKPKREFGQRVYGERQDSIWKALYDS